MAERDTKPTGEAKKESTERMPDEVFPQNRGFSDFGTHGGPHHANSTSKPSPAKGQESTRKPD